MSRHGHVTRLIAVGALAGAAAISGGAATARAGGSAGAKARASEAQLEQRVGWESYWYSLYNLSALSMGKSGMGIQFTAPKAKLMGLLKLAGLKQPPLASLVAQAFHQAGAAKAARTAAGSAWAYLNSHYWSAKAGLYLPKPGAGTQSYTPGLIADLTGACNVAGHVLGAKQAGPRYATFFVNAIDHSRLLASQLPFTANEHNGLPMPPKAGGAYGIAPVFLSGVAYDTGNGSWKVTDGRFTTASALELADEMFWMGTWAGQPVKGPPSLGLPYLHA